MKSVNENQKSVNICKNFTDGIAFFASFAALIVVLFAIKEFDPDDPTLKFWQVASTMTYIKIAAVFFISGLLNVLTRAVAPVGIAAALIPAWMSFATFIDDTLDLHPMIYIVFGLVHLSGALIYTTQWLLYSENFSKEGKKSVWVALILAELGLVIWLLPRIFINVRLQNELEAPLMIVLGCGILSGIIGISWALRIDKRLGDSQRSVILWRGISSIACCVIIILLKTLLRRFGI